MAATNSATRAPLESLIRNPSRAASLPPSGKSIMDYMTVAPADIDGMPRGGPDASCLDRLLQTERTEYLDRDARGDPGEEARKRSVVRALEVTGNWFGNHEKFA